MRTKVTYLIIKDKKSPIDTFFLFQVLSKVEEENILKEFSSFNPKQNLFYVQFETKVAFKLFLKTPRLLLLNFRESGRSFHRTAPL